jgi:hypothetical protein
MANPIEENATKILIALFENNPEKNLMFYGNDIAEMTQLEPNDINDAIEFLDERDLIERINYLGTKPYTFGTVNLNSRGSYIYHELQEADNETDSENQKSDIVSNQPLAAGSPFGFTDLDWEYVQQERIKSNVLKVVIGYQFKSDYYDSEKLVENIQSEFISAIDKYNSKKGRHKVELNFKPLAAGY